jgi:hypothetical protein
MNERAVAARCAIFRHKAKTFVSVPEAHAADPVDHPNETRHSIFTLVPKFVLVKRASTPFTHAENDVRVGTCALKITAAHLRLPLRLRRPAQHARRIAHHEHSPPLCANDFSVQLSTH